MPTSFDKISPTASLVTYARQFSDIPYAMEISELVKAQSVVEQYATNGVEELKYFAPVMEARYKALNWILATFDCRQIVELASGLLPRGMVMSEDPAITFVESDLPLMIEQKRAVVDRLVENRANLHFAAIDVTANPSQFPVNADYLRRGEPIAIACEGLLQYLTLHEKQQVFANVRQMLQPYGGVWITPDLTTKQRRSQLRNYHPAMERILQAIAQNTGRSTLDNSFENLEHMQQFVADQGFQLQSFAFTELLDQLSSLKRLGISPNSIKPLLAGTSIFALTLS
ncbi:class I SAM-dependent methyltransferase [Leptolyngbya sp. Cla-17]|uniref:class I SAM-dependent methyltransferase n=1 Tax=Leptolyngbya sp. Cla-17 TaxID=2803751 RepID=UPI0018D9416B|nr:class I SAM-dependent methyltransferase [Leptolyngbya sp. Cla-17]